jgi:hypothetical protein
MNDRITVNTLLKCLNNVESSLNVYVLTSNKLLNLGTVNSLFWSIHGHNDKNVAVETGDEHLYIINISLCEHSLILFPYDSFGKITTDKLFFGYSVVLGDIVLLSDRIYFKEKEESRVEEKEESRVEEQEDIVDKETLVRRLENVEIRLDAMSRDLYKLLRDRPTIIKRLEGIENKLEVRWPGE